MDESANKMPKAEFAYRESFANTRELQVKLSDYVHWYNNFRIHSTPFFEPILSTLRTGLSLRP